MTTAAGVHVWDRFQQALKRYAPEADGSQIRKLEIAKSGALLAQLRDGSRPLWLSWDRERISELHPAADAQIPLSGLLRERGEDPTLEILNYRPEKRLVVLDRGRVEPRVIKGYRSGRAAPAFERYEAARKACRGDDIRAPEVLELVESSESLVMAFEPGRPLDLSSGAVDVFYGIGVGLANFQRRGSEIEADNFSSADELKVIDRFVDKVAAAGLELPPGWEALRERLEAAVPTLPESSHGLCHRDLYDKQFTFNGHSLTLLDFDLMCRADVALDPANFLAHMALRQFQGVNGASATGIAMCGAQLLEGLGRNDEAGFWERLRFYQASSFCRLALVYTLRPCWAALVPLLVRMGERSLDDLRRIQGG
jgi:hypothetical protein